jgi:hypothetical protein
MLRGFSMSVTSLPNDLFYWSTSPTNEVIPGPCPNVQCWQPHGLGKDTDISDYSSHLVQVPRASPLIHSGMWYGAS